MSILVFSRNYEIWGMSINVFFQGYCHERSGDLPQLLCPSIDAMSFNSVTLLLASRSSEMSPFFRIIVKQTRKVPL